MLNLTAVNHWDVAIATHTANHPSAKHILTQVDLLRSRDLSATGKLDILWASPSCTEHSYAKGGNDIDDQNRHSAWSVLRETERYEPRIVIVENVPPFRNWGPVEKDRKGNVRPVKARKGETFRAWFSAIESLGYSGRWQLLNSADYGEAQTRIRFFAMFRNDGQPIVFPEPTHGRRGDDLLGKREPWRAARDIIDWSLLGGSIFERKTPLAPNTMRRIEAGIRRYCSGALAEAFLVVLRNHADASSLDDPTPTVTAGGTHIGLAEPSLTAFVGGNRAHNVPVAVDGPAPTVTTAHGGGLYLAEPTAFVIGQQSGSIPREVDEPLPTIAQGGAISVVQSFAIDVRHGERVRTQSLDDPFGTLTAKNGLGVVEPFIATYYGNRGDDDARTNSVDLPLPTVPTANRFGVVEPFIVPQMGDGTRSVDLPSPTVTTTTRGMRLIEPSVDLVEPVILPADESAPPGRVVIIDGKPYMLDVRFRMLQPHELARAQGFPDDYKFTGTKSDQTAQIGNAVPEKVAYALGRAVLLSIGYRDPAVVAA